MCTRRRTPQRAPVLIFAHGGALIEGDKDRTPEIHSNVCWCMTRHDMIGVNLEYRLAPEARYPDVTHDIAAAVRWTRANIAKFGGDPGAHLPDGPFGRCACTWGTTPTIGASIPPKARAWRASIVLSGRVRAETLPDNPLARNVIAYFGDDQDAMAQGSMVTHVAPDTLPTLIGVAEYENPLIDVHSAELIHRLAHVKRRAPPFFSLARHNHTSSVAQINTADDLVGPRIVDFIRRAAPPRVSALRQLRRACMRRWRRLRARVSAPAAACAARVSAAAQPPITPHATRAPPPPSGAG